MKVILDPQTSKRIFELARDQQEELNLSGDDEIEEDEAPGNFSRPRAHIASDDEDEDDVGQGDMEEDVEVDFVSWDPENGVSGGDLRNLAAEHRFRRHADIGRPPTLQCW